MKELIKVSHNGFWENRQPPTQSLKKAAELFNEINGKTIIEIGTGIQGELSGNSVLQWVKQTKAERIICLDLEQKHVDEVKNECKIYQNVEAILYDGLKYLREFKGTIDLLYLDFWVKDKKGEMLGTARSKHYLKAFKNAKNNMNEKSIILIDDTDHIDPWKQTLIIPEARKSGYQVLWVGRQTCLFRNI